MFDPDAYLARVGLARLPAADIAGLAAVQRAHRLSIPFENLDIALGRGISLDPAAVFGKLVTARRGGYCFEQNQLFLAALRAIGFEARPLLARVWLMAEGVPPRTHTFNLVTLDGAGWLLDAGFGGSYIPPLRLEDGPEIVTEDGAGHRLRALGDGGWLLERRGAAPEDAWQAQYGFTLDCAEPADLEMGNHWTATRPGTRFTLFRIASRARPHGFVSLVDRSLTITGEGAARIEIADAAHYRALLRDEIGISLSAQEVAALGLF